MGPPRRIDQYDIVGVLGEGAMARVFRARAAAPAAPGGARARPSAMPDVALKLIAEHLAHAREFQLRFFDEVRVSTALSHPNIVRTFGAGTWRGRPYLVMELVDGLSVRQLIGAATGPGRLLPLEVVLHVGIELCAALDYAHRYARPGMPLSLVHRDVSPSNVLVSRRGEVKLADFGLAKARGRVVASSADLLKGKLGYMAPEQVRGAEEPRSDLYSLAAVLYELLCGQPIRQGATLESVRLARVPRAPSTLRAIPRQLDSLLLRCLSPNPGRRPASAADLRAHLRLLLERQVAGAADPANAARDKLVEVVQRVLAPAAPPPPVESSRRPAPTGPAPAAAAGVAAAPAPAPALQERPSEPSIMPAREAREAQEQAPRKMRRLLISVSAALFVAAGGAIGAMLALGGADEARPPTMRVRDAMVPGYARRVPVLTPRRLDAGAARADLLSGTEGGGRRKQPR